MTALHCPNPKCGRLLADCPCGFCHGQPVGNATTWLDGRPRPAAPCPRCGQTNPSHPNQLPHTTSQDPTTIEPAGGSS